MTSGQDVLRKARIESRGPIAATVLFSIFVNILMLTGPLYMLQIYDRVLRSKSEETLVALSLIVGFLFIAMGLLDYVRVRIMARVAARFQHSLDREVFERKLSSETHSNVTYGLKDLAQIHRFATSPALLAFIDLPWTPLFILAIFVFHPWLGILAIFGGTILVLLGVLGQWCVRKPTARAIICAQNAWEIAAQAHSEKETIKGLGMQSTVSARWEKARFDEAKLSLAANDSAAAFTASSKAVRLFLQSAMLGLGAFLALRGELTGGAMIASSILLGRALAPLELIINRWELLQEAVLGWKNLSKLLPESSSQNPATRLPKPAGSLTVSDLTVIPPLGSRPCLRMVNFYVPKGKALGVIGSSGSGKSSLARAITGIWQCAGGEIRLDGAALNQFSHSDLGKHIGYMPQRLSFFDGSVAENIARFDENYDPNDVIEAAKISNAHDMILTLPQGYDTLLNANNCRLSGGQIQRIGLARALFHKPAVVVLDEPNANLDDEGSKALNDAIRRTKLRGGTVIIMAHRPAAIQECELLLALKEGACRGFGPKNRVMNEILENAKNINQAARAVSAT